MTPATSHENQAREAARVILGEAPQLTTGQLAARLRRLTVTFDPEDSRHRYETGVEERRVIGEANPDGTANLLAFNLPPETVVAALERVNRLAKEANTSGDERSIDQIRADVFCDLVTGRGLSAAPAGSVDITVDLATLTGFSEVPGEIPGWGPVIADIARQVAVANERGQWRLASPTRKRGQVVWNGTTRRRPTATERRYIQARQPVCVFPGCRMPARDSDLDHTHDYAKGGRDPPPQPRTTLPPPPPFEARSRVETRTTHTRHIHLDQPPRTYLPLTRSGALSYVPVCPAATLHSWSVVTSAAMAAWDCSSVSSWTRQNSFPKGSCITAQSIRGR